MAKKKRKKRPRPKAAPEGQPRTARQERKEQARREREALVRRAKRRRALRRIGVWAAVVAVIGGAVAFFLIRRAQEAERREEIALIAEQIGCGDVQENPDEGRGHLTPGEAPPTYQNVPATSGRHTPGTLPPDVSVYEDPVPEVTAIHNLEHGYVIMYYRQEGENAVSQDVVDSLADLAESRDEVILAPYPDLPEGENLVLVSWNRVQRCSLDDPPVDDVRAVARGYIDRFLNSGEAPEPAAA